MMAHRPYDYPGHTAIGAALAEARKAAGIPQKAAAKRVRRPQSWLSMVERGQTRCTAPEFIALVQALGSDVLALHARYIQLRFYKTFRRDHAMTGEANHAPGHFARARFLKSRREELKLSVDEMAERSRMSAERIAQLESGEQSPFINELEALAAALDMPLFPFITKLMRSTEAPEQESTP